jgi:hypothetical protein
MRETVEFRLPEEPVEPPMIVMVTARPTNGDVILSLERKTDMVAMDVESALAMAKALNEAVQFLEGDPEAEIH